ncbi:MAG: discoidin domain-containing protein [Ignavibacterium sp.]|nr:discoidin domain-containing protein [Ignavibacterium sp.]
MSILRKIDLSGGSGGGDGQTTYTAPNGIVVTSSSPTWVNNGYYWMGYLFNHTAPQNTENYYYGTLYTYWLCQDSSASLTFDFGAIPVEKRKIKKIRIAPRYRGDSVVSFKIQKSQNKTSWTDITPKYLSGSAPYGYFYTHTFNESISDRYIRILLLREEGAYTGLSEIEFYEEVESSENDLPKNIENISLYLNRDKETFISIPHQNHLSLQKNMTIEFDIKLSTKTYSKRWTAIIYKGDTSDNRNYSVWYNNDYGYLRFTCENLSGKGFVLDTPKLNRNMWYNIKFVIDGSLNRGVCYVNGEIVAQFYDTIGSFTTNNEDLYIGGFSYCYGESVEPYIDCQIKNLKIYNKVIYSDLDKQDKESLVLNMPFDQKSAEKGNICYDFSIYQNHGYIYNPDFKYETENLFTVNKEKIRYNQIIYVDPVNGRDNSTNGPYQTITKAISVAPNDSIIYLKGGEYILNSPLNINKHLTFVGERENTIITVNANKFIEQGYNDIIVKFIDLKINCSATTTLLIEILNGSVYIESYGYDYRYYFETKYRLIKIQEYNKWTYTLKTNLSFIFENCFIEVKNSNSGNLVLIPEYTYNCFVSFKNCVIKKHKNKNIFYIDDVREASHIYRNSALIQRSYIYNEYSFSVNFFRNGYQNYWFEYSKLWSEDTENWNFKWRYVDRKAYNPDGTPANIGLYGGPFAWGNWGGNTTKTGESIEKTFSCKLEAKTKRKEIETDYQKKVCSYPILPEWLWAKFRSIAKETKFLLQINEANKNYYEELKETTWVNFKFGRNNQIVKQSIVKEQPHQMVSKLFILQSSDKKETEISNTIDLDMSNNKIEKQAINQNKYLISIEKQEIKEEKTDIEKDMLLPDRYKNAIGKHVSFVGLEKKNETNDTIESVFYEPKHAKTEGNTKQTMFISNFIEWLKVNSKNELNNHFEMCIPEKIQNSNNNYLDKGAKTHQSYFIGGKEDTLNDFYYGVTDTLEDRQKLLGTFNYGLFIITPNKYKGLYEEKINKYLKTKIISYGYKRDVSKIGRTRELPNIVENNTFEIALQKTIWIQNDNMLPRLDWIAIEHRTGKIYTQTPVLILGTTQPFRSNLIEEIELRVFENYQKDEVYESQVKIIEPEAIAWVNNNTNHVNENLMKRKPMAMLLGYYSSNNSISMYPSGSFTLYNGTNTMYIKIKDIDNLSYVINSVLEIYSDSYSGTITIKPVISDWDWNTISWNNQPQTKNIVLFSSNVASYTRVSLEYILKEIKANNYKGLKIEFSGSLRAYTSYSNVSDSAKLKIITHTIENKETIGNEQRFNISLFDVYKKGNQIRVRFRSEELPKYNSGTKIQGRVKINGDWTAWSEMYDVFIDDSPIHEMDITDFVKPNQIQTIQDALRFPRATRGKQTVFKNKPKVGDIIKADELIELRQFIEEGYEVTDREVEWTDPEIIRGVTPRKKIHWKEIIQYMKDM